MIKELLKEAIILKNKGYYKHAIETLYKALENDHSSLELLFEIAESYFFMGDIERCLEYIEQILDKAPSHINSLKLLKNIFIQKEAWAEAEQTAKNIYCISEKNEDLVEIFKLLNKQKRYDEIFDYNIKIETSDTLYEKAFAKFYSNKLNEAKIFIDKALDISPNSTKLLLLKGNILLQLNNDEEAYELLKTLNITNENDTLLNFAGIVYQRRGEYKKAIDYFLNSLKYSKEKDICYYNCASTYFKMGDNIQAKKYYNLAISKNPNNPSYHIALANLYYSEKNYKRAMEELKSELYEARLLKAVILHDAGYLAIAKKEFEALIKEFPEDEIVQEHLNKINLELEF